MCDVNCAAVIEAVGQGQHHCWGETTTEATWEDELHSPQVELLCALICIKVIGVDAEEVLELRPILIILLPRIFQAKFELLYIGAFEDCFRPITCGYHIIINNGKIRVVERIFSLQFLVHDEDDEDHEVTVIVRYEQGIMIFKQIANRRLACHWHRDDTFVVNIAKGFIWRQIF